MKISTISILFLFIIFSIGIFASYQVDISSTQEIVSDSPIIADVNAAILQYPGTWDINLDLFKILNNNSMNPGFNITWEAVNIGDPLEAFLNYEILYITGDSLYEFTDNERAKLADFFENGGTIWIDNSGDLQFENFFILFNFSQEGIADIRESRITDQTHPIISGINSSYTLDDEDVRNLGDNIINCHYIDVFGSELDILIYQPADTYEWPLTIYASFTDSGEILVTCQHVGKGIMIKDVEDLRFGYNVLYWMKELYKEPIYLSDPSCTVSYSDNVLINTTLTDEQGNPISDRNITFEYAVIGEDWKLIGQVLTNENGLASIIFEANIALGEYNLKVSFAGDGSYRPIETLGWLTIIQENTSIKLLVEVCTFSDEAKFSAILTDDEGALLKDYIVYFEFSEDGENWTPLGENVTDENGVAKLDWICELRPENYFVRSLFKGDTYYLGSESREEFIVERELTQLSVSTEGGYYSDLVGFYAQLSDDDGVPISDTAIFFEISKDGINWIVLGENVTDENGIAVFGWTCDLLPGNYILEVHFAGNDYYSASEIRVDLVIEKEVTRIYAYLAEGNYSDSLELCAFILDDEDVAVPNVFLNFYIYVDDWVLIGFATSDENGYTTLLYDVVLSAGSYDLKVVFEGNEYYSNSYEVLGNGLTVLSEQVVISMFLDDHIYLLVPTVINVSLMDNEGNPVPYVNVIVLINDTSFLEIETPENGSFSFTWTPGELAVYNLTIISIETPYYAAGKEDRLIFADFSCEELILEAIRELDYIGTQVDFPCILSRIRNAKWRLYRSLEYSSEEDYWKAFLRIRCATCLVKSMLNYHKLEAPIYTMLEHVAFKLATAVRYKVKESLEYAEDFEGCAKTPGKPKKIKTSSEVLLDRAWRFYDRGISEISAERYSKAISRFIIAYRLVMIVLRCGKHG